MATKTLYYPGYSIESADTDSYKLPRPPFYTLVHYRCVGNNFCDITASYAGLWELKTSEGYCVGKGLLRLCILLFLHTYLLYVLFFRWH